MLLVGITEAFLGIIKGEVLMDLLPHANVLFLLKTWEHDTCQFSHISRCVTHSLWWPSINLQGQGGRVVIYKEELKIWLMYENWTSTSNIYESSYVHQVDQYLL